MNVYEGRRGVGKGGRDGGGKMNGEIVELGWLYYLTPDCVMVRVRGLANSFCNYVPGWNGLKW